MNPIGLHFFPRKNAKPRTRLSLAFVHDCFPYCRTTIRMILDSLAGVEQERLENVKKTGGTKGTDGEGVGDFPLEGDDHPSLGDVYAQNL